MQPDSRKRYKVAKSVKHVRNLCIHTDTPCERPSLQESIGSSDAAEDRSVMRVMPSADNCERQNQRQRRRHSLPALQGTGWGGTLYFAFLFLRPHLILSFSPIFRNRHKAAAIFDSPPWPQPADTCPPSCGRQQSRPKE